MGFAYIDSTSDAGSTNSTTSSAIDTTGAGLLIVGLSYYGSSPGTNPTITDSKGNTWFALTPSYYNAESVIYYCFPTVVGSGHTVTVARAGFYGSVTFAAFSGAGAFDIESAGGTTDSSDGVDSTAASAATGITPSQDNCLVIANVCLSTDGIASSVDGGFTMLTPVAKDPVNYQGTALAYLIQTAAAAADPTFTLSLNNDWAVSLASFAWASATIPVFLGDRVLDNGLAALDTEASHIYVHDTQPTTYASATTSAVLGFKSFGAGSVFGSPAAGTPDGRKVTSAAVTGGTITTSGTVGFWSVVDVPNTRLLAAGALSGGGAVTAGQSWTMDPIAIHLPTT